MKRSDINIRDPFVLVRDGKYYLYGTRGPECWGRGTGLDCYVGTDLENFEDPVEVFTPPIGFWSDKNYWAPEVHEYKGNFYMFVSFKADGVCRGTQILKADNPLGPFILHSAGPVTPRDWECLDGTFYYDTESGKPYIVFSHEWVQTTDGEICALELDDELWGPIGSPRLLFRASEAPWIKPFREVNYVTDGPFVYRNSKGKLTILWSSFGEKGYVLAMAHSESNSLNGPWKQDPELLFEDNGGHGMLFTDLEGKLRVALHYPNVNLKERPVFIPVDKEI